MPARSLISKMELNYFDECLNNPFFNFLWEEVAACNNKMKELEAALKYYQGGLAAERRYTEELELRLEAMERVVTNMSVEYPANTRNQIQGVINQHDAVVDDLERILEEMTEEEDNNENEKTVLS